MFAKSVVNGYIAQIILRLTIIFITFIENSLRRLKNIMRRTKLPTSYKGGEKCKSCGAIVIHSYNQTKHIYQWKCQGCGATRYESGAKFETRFIGADRL